MVHDPICDSYEAITTYGIKLIQDSESYGPFEAIILAVGHQNYSDWDSSQWTRKLIKGGVIIDVKGIVPKEALDKLGIRIWRL